MQVERVLSLTQEQIQQFNASFPDQNWDVQHCVRFFSDPKNILLFCFDSTEIVGFVIAYKLDRLDSKNAEVLLYEVETKSTKRRQGIGKLLFVELKKIAKESGAHEIWVLTSKTNEAAVKYYLSQGAQTETVEDIMYVFPL
ncbi:MAG TPA: GNAT family N-acetyltransferase [Patescibacteria group bacterium]|nr:GNAT family N-acetyltransferase [Patescibacteria group bacterium]